MQDDRVEIAGKTGTAFPVEPGIGYNKAKRRYAFAGFFPYDKPRYSCMALVLASGGTSANRTSGQVVKNIALKLYSRGMLNNTSNFTDERDNTMPTLYASDKHNVGKVKNDLGAQSAKQMKANGKHSTGVMPDVRGYDVASAINILERAGLSVVVKGKGYVQSQSVAPGASVKKGQKITLTLNT